MSESGLIYNELMGNRWWTASKDDIYKEIFKHLSYLNNEQAYRNAENIKNMRLYGNYDVIGIDAYNYARVESSLNITHRVTLNVIQSMIETVVSKITKNKPKPTFLTDAGDWDLQQKAKKLTKFCEGIFYSANVYAEATKAFRDSCIMGTGVVKFYVENNEVKCERVMTDEIKIDDSESFYGKPRTIHQVKYLQKDVVSQAFPGNDFFIDGAGRFENEYSINRTRHNPQLIYVVESWHLPSGPNSGDGKHTICISNKTLFEEKYDKNYFPFILFRWIEKPVGWWGIGIAEQLTGIQLEINKILKTIQVSMHLVSVPKLLVEASSKIVTAHLNNKVGGIIKYAGTPPSYAALGGIPPELFSHLDRLYSRAFEIIGISALSAQSSKPAGLDSGKALREFNDIESERFLATGIRYEQAFMDAAKIIVGLAKDIYKDVGEFKVKVKGQSFIETIDWGDIDIEDDKYMMEIFPTSSLSSTPSARLQDVTDLLQAGFIDKKDAMRLLDFPDLRAVTNLEQANIEDINRTIDLMMKTGIYTPPESYQDLQTGVKLFQSSYLLFKSQNAPDEKLELIRRWIEDANALIDQMNAAEVPPALPEEPGVSPMAVPEAKPTSDILPVA